MMTHSELISFAWENILPMFGYPNGMGTFESNMCQTIEKPDIIWIGDKVDECVVIECKASRQDFLKDCKKPFRVFPDKGMGKYRVYVVNEGVVNYASELPEGWMCFIVIDKDTFTELASPTTDTSAKDAKDWWRKYEFKERNWKAEYTTWRFLSYWQKDRGYKPKTPKTIGTDYAKFRKLTKEEYALFEYERRTKK